MAERLKVTATLHAVEDPELVAHLEEVEGDDRAARVRRLMRRGFESLRANMMMIPVPTGVAVAATAAVASESQHVPSGLESLGLNPNDFQWGARAPS